MKGSQESSIALNAIRKVVRALRQSSKETERRIGLSAAQLFVLQKIAESERPLSVNDLAERTLTHQSSVSVVVSKLVRRGWVERVTSPEDRRSAAIRLSERGRRLAGEKHLLPQESLLIGFAKLTPHERRGLVRGLEAWIDKSNLGKGHAPLFFEDSDENGVER